MSFEPYIPWAFWVLLVLAAAALLTWYAVAGRRRLPRRRWLGVIVLMGVAVAIPLVLLLNPIWLERIPPPAGKPLLTILVDRSASMATGDGEDDRTRYGEASRIAVAVAEELKDRYEIRTVAFAADSSVDSPEGLTNREPDGAVTDLAGAIEDALEDDRPQGQAMLLLSDGIHNAGGGTARLRESVAKAKAMTAPLYVKSIGGEGGVEDLEVSVNLPQELAFVGQRVPVIVTLRQRGSLAERTKLSLISDGETLETRDAKLTADGTTEEIFNVTREKNGLYRFELRAEPLAGEVTGVNNTATLLLRVVDEPVRVLLLEGKPYWDTKFLIRTLAMDKSIELTSVVQMAEGRFLERTISHDAKAVKTEGKDSGDKPAEEADTKKEDAGEDATKEDGEKPEADAAPKIAPRVDRWKIRKDGNKVLGDPDALAKYQIVILGRDAEVFLTDDALLRLKKWLAEGDGSLVCFRGPPSSQINQRLGELMPVRWTPSRESRFRVAMTDAGKSLRWLPSGEGDDVLTNLPPLAAVARAEKPKPLAVVLATTVAEDGKTPVPAITYQPVGNGRVVVVEGAGMWRWAFLPVQYKQHDNAYGMLWRSLVRWLVANAGLLPSQELALRTDKVTFSTSENATATLLVREDRASGEPPEIELTGDALPQPRHITPLASGAHPGQFRIPLGHLPEGKYQARVVGNDDEVSSVASFDVRGNLKERLDVGTQPNVMKLIAERSGGAVLEQAEPQQLAQQFDAHLTKSRPERMSRTTAWDRWWILVSALGLWAVAWGLRRGSGLV